MNYVVAFLLVAVLLYLLLRFAPGALSLLGLVTAKRLFPDPNLSQGAYQC